MLLDELRLTTGSKSDWPYFARWHYRSHQLGLVRFVTLLWHADQPIGICVFQSPPLSLRQRNRFFGTSGRWTRTGLRALNRKLVMLSRVVLHPSWRGAGVAAQFVRASCRACPFDWIEALAQMGHINPFFEKAGFVRVGVSRSTSRTIAAHSALWGGRGRTHGTRKRKSQVSAETHAKSRHAEPVYYIFDNRR
ncbi:MAG: hypothetical protein WD069_17105 [Planctomycetales bacterium]